MRRLFAICVLTLGLVACGGQEQDTTAPVETATTDQADQFTPVVPTANFAFTPEITAEDLAAHVKTLASDEFEGRKPGTIGERLTTAYIKDTFERIGLQPGNNGSWFQTVPMMTTVMIDPDDVTLEVTAGDNKESFALAKDMVIGTLNASPEIDIDASDIVFAGYGISAPEYGWNDYDDLDVTGKTVIVLVNDPGFATQNDELFQGNALTYYGRWTYKYEEAARQGAAALLIVHTDDAAGYPWSVVQSGWTGPQDALPPSEDPAPRLPAAGWLTKPAADRLFAAAGKDFDELMAKASERGFEPVPLDATLATHFRSEISTTSSENVIGYLPGSERPDETIVYTAHWDHFGIDPNIEGDNIYSGAIDNASGVAAIMEIAAAFAAQETPPKRSVMFLAVTLEESGLLGSAYYAAHPVFPLDKTVANINVDALPITGASRDVIVIGLGQSELDEYVTEAAAAGGRTITPDASPEKGYFFRSDHLNFARNGVPILYAQGGLDLVEGGVEAGRKLADDYTQNRYHKPADKYDPNWNWAGIVQDTKMMYEIGKKLASEDTFPQWKPGSDFKRPGDEAAQ